MIVCDNASADDSLLQLANWAQARFSDSFVRLSRAAVNEGAALPAGAAMALVENGANLGFAAGNNVGIRLALRDAGCQYVWVLNNDTVVKPDALQQTVDLMAGDPGLGMCGSTLVYFHAPAEIQALGGAVYSKWTGRSRHLGAFAPLASVPADGRALALQFSYVVGAAMLVSRAFVERVGLMTEDYFLYCEEIDWATRGLAAQFRLGYAPLSTVFHKEGASVGTAPGGGSPLSLYFLYRNRLRFGWRFHAAFVPTVLWFCALDIAKLVLRRRWPQARAALRGLVQLPRAVPVTT